MPLTTFSCHSGVVGDETEYMPKENHEHDKFQESFNMSLRHFLDDSNMYYKGKMDAYLEMEYYSISKTKQ